MNCNLWQITLPALVTGLFGWIGGDYIHKQTAEWEKKKLLYDQQVKVWESLTTNFPKYLVNRGRLRAITEHEHQNAHKLSQADKEDIARRKERYLEGRDFSRLNLMGDLEQAKILFPTRGANYLSAYSLIEMFEEFENKAQSLTSPQSPPESEWRDHMRSILNATYEQIKPL